MYPYPTKITYLHDGSVLFTNDSYNVLHNDLIKIFKEFTTFRFNYDLGGYEGPIRRANYENKMMNVNGRYSRDIDLLFRAFYSKTRKTDIIYSDNTDHYYSLEEGIELPPNPIRENSRWAWRLKFESESDLILFKLKN